MHLDWKTLENVNPTVLAFPEPMAAAAYQKGLGRSSIQLVPGSATAAERQPSKLVGDWRSALLHWHSSLLDWRSSLLPELSRGASSSSKQFFFPHLGAQKNAQLAQLTSTAL